MQANKHISVIVQLSEFGGTNEFFFNSLVPALIKSDISYTIFAEKKAIEIIKKNIHGIKMIEIPERSRVFSKLYFNLLYDLYIYFFYFRKDKPDFLFLSLASTRSFIGLNLIKSKAIILYHTMPQKYSLKGLPIKWMTKIFTNKRHLFVSVSQTAVDSLIENLGVPKAFCRVLYNGVKLPDIYIRENILEKKETIRVLTVGSFVYYKNPKVWLDTAITIIQKHDNVEFLWIGDGEEFDSYHKVISDKCLEGKIRLYGRQKNVEKFYKSADIYFQPSLIESHGIAVLEAMSFALPCITSNTGGLKESVLDQKTGFVAKSNESQTFVQLIEMYIGNSNLRLEHGIQGRKRVENYFTKQKQIKEIRNLFDSISFV